MPKRKNQSEVLVIENFYIFTQAQNWQWHANVNPYLLSNLTLELASRITGLGLINTASLQLIYS